jgi:hypothetical protein
VQQEEVLSLLQRPTLAKWALIIGQFGAYGYELSPNQSCFLDQSKKDNIVKYILGRSETRLCDLLRLLLFILTQD